MADTAIVVAGDVHDAPTSHAMVAVGEARTHLPPAEELLAIKKLATQTKAIGIILPPPDIRAIIDKTSQFVAKHGEGGGGVVARHAPTISSQEASSRSASWPTRRTMSSSTFWSPPTPTTRITSCG